MNIMPYVLFDRKNLVFFYNYQNLLQAVLESKNRNSKNITEVFFKHTKHGHTQHHLLNSKYFLSGGLTFCIVAVFTKSFYERTVLYQVFFNNIRSVVFLGSGSDQE